MNPVLYIDGPKGHREDGESNKEVFTAHTFLEYIRKSSPHWWNDLKSSHECPWVFRGHWNADWKLIPTAARPNFEGAPMFKTIVENLIAELEENSTLWGALNLVQQDQFSRCWAHAILIEKFVKLSRELSLSNAEIFTTHVKASDWLDQYLQNIYRFRDIGDFECFTKLLQDDENQALRYTAFQAYDFLKEHSVSLAQHHGIPTFLLDWSQDPLASCFFATDKPKGERADNGLAVWALNMNLLPSKKPTSCEYTSIVGLIRPAKSDNEFLANQSGILTYVRRVDRDWNKNGLFPDLESIFKTRGADATIEATRKEENKLSDTDASIKEVRDTPSYNSTFLKKITLPAKELEPLKILLRREGITKAHMMPTLDNVAATALNNLRDQT